MSAKDWDDAKVIRQALALASGARLADLMIDLGLDVTSGLEFSQRCRDVLLRLNEEDAA